MHKKLFIPGPTEVAPDVLQKMATPMIGHRSRDASALQHEISDKLRKVFLTANPILLSSSSGSGLMEGSIRSLTAKPYDVLNSAEARVEAAGYPPPCLHVGKPEIDLPLDMHLTDDRVYRKTNENLEKLIFDSTTITAITGAFRVIPNLYVADGHHRSAAARVGRDLANSYPHRAGMRSTTSSLPMSEKSCHRNQRGAIRSCKR